jgi:hypothetical protein
MTHRLGVRFTGLGNSAASWLVECLGMRRVWRLCLRLHLVVRVLVGAVALSASMLASRNSAAGVPTIKPALATSVTPALTSTSVPFGVWLGELALVLGSAPAPSADGEFSAFAKKWKLPEDNDSLRRDYRRIRLLFEAVRDGGFWHLRWDITDQYPSSQRIWKAFIERAPINDFAAPSATAECDESSALMGLLSRRLAIANVGLFYPTWNHTIAAWAPLAGKSKGAGLVMLPTTQIFLDCEAGFDSTSFRTRLKNIERYPGWDIKDTTLLPQARAEWLLDQIRVNAAASAKLWSLIRAARAYQLDSSMARCHDMRAAMVSDLKRELTQGDEVALKALASRELHHPEMKPRDVLEWLGKT